MFVMITSGWQHLRCFAAVRVQISARHHHRGRLDGLSGALLWHFAAMWLFVVNGIDLRHARHRRAGDFAASSCRSARAKWCAICAPRLTGRLSHDDLSVYNAVQRLLYLGRDRGRRRGRAVRAVDLEAGAVPGTHRRVRRIRRRRATFTFSRWRRSSAFSLVHVTLADPGAEEPARDDHRPLTAEEGPMRKIRKRHSGRRCQAADQGCRKAAARSVTPAVPARRHEPRCHHVA